MKKKSPQDQSLAASAFRATELLDQRVFRIEEHIRAEVVRVNKWGKEMETWGMATDAKALDLRARADVTDAKLDALEKMVKANIFQGPNFRDVAFRKVYRPFSHDGGKTIVDLEFYNDTAAGCAAQVIDSLRHAGFEVVPCPKT